MPGRDGEPPFSGLGTADFPDAGAVLDVPGDDGPGVVLRPGLLVCTLVVRGAAVGVEVFGAEVLRAAGA